MRGSLATLFWASTLALAACSAEITTHPRTNREPGAAANKHPTGANGSVADPSKPSATAGSGSSDGKASSDPGSTPSAPACTDLGTVGAPVPLRRLTATQVERSVADVLGVKQKLNVTDERLLTFRSNVSTPIDATAARGYLDFAEGAVAAADLSRCAGKDCLPWLLDEVGLRLFRRPLADEQRARYASLYQLGAQEGARWVLEAMLQSPSFTYLDEVAGDDGYLDGYSLASRMALVLWGSNPDAELLALAKSGGLATAEEVRSEAARMLADPRSEGGLREFVDQWLGLDRLDDADTRPDLAKLGADTLAALREEPVALLRSMLQQGKGLKELLTTSETVRSDALAAIYGDDIASTSGAAFSLDPSKRAGILSLPGVMAAAAHAGQTSPTRRGYAVLASFLCAPPPPPPPGVNPTLPDVGPDATARERLEAHFSSDVCGSCHRQMDGIGFAFERFDELGQSRTTDHGKAIDDMTAVALDGKDVQLQGEPDLARALAQSDVVAECVARQWAHYATGVPANDDAACLLQRMGSDVTADGGLEAMMLSYLSSDWFRRGGQP